jgi:hypothetical protein
VIENGTPVFTESSEDGSPGGIDSQAQEWTWFRSEPGEVIDVDEEEEEPKFLEEEPGWWAPDSPGGPGWRPTSPDYGSGGSSGESERRLE